MTFYESMNRRSSSITVVALIALLGLALAVAAIGQNMSVSMSNTELATSCPNGKVAFSENSSGVFTCVYPTVSPFSYTNNTQVSTTHGVTTPIQVGMKISYTANSTNVYVFGVVGEQTSLATCGIQIMIDYGTGSAPNQGSAQIGTIIGGAGGTIFNFMANSGTQYSGSLGGLAMHLTIGQTYWFDEAFSSAPTAGGCGTATWSGTYLTFMSV
jgi:hypothetical protein